MSAEGIVLIIGAIFLGLGQLYTMYLSHETKKKVEVAEERREVIAEAIIDPKVHEIPPPTQS